MHPCSNCEKLIDVKLNYCNWDCLLESAKKAGGQTHAPNRLPITCVRADGTMLEHETADHPDYKFPVEVEFVGVKPALPDWDLSFSNESHGLIYFDDYVALTMYECTYSLWSLSDGKSLGGRMYAEEGWRLSDSSIQKIKEQNEKNVSSDATVEL